MIRMEIEAWSEKFLKDIFENTKPVQDLAKKALAEDWDMERFEQEMFKLVANQEFKTYSQYSKQLADFIEEVAADTKK